MINFGKQRALIAALAAFGVVAPGVTIATAPAATQQVKQDTGTPAPTVNVPSSAQFILPASFARFFRAHEPIWIGKQKRGNRRNRSRFNYNR